MRSLDIYDGVYGLESGYLEHSECQVCGDTKSIKERLNKLKSERYQRDITEIVCDDCADIFNYPGEP